MTIEQHHPVLAVLASNANFVFYPTGSRFLGCNKEYSDHDFFVVVEWDNAKELKAMMDVHGFRTQERGGYCVDDRLDAVYTWTDPDRRLPGVDILAGRREEIDRRRAVFDVMRRVMYRDNGLESYDAEAVADITRRIKKGPGWRGLYAIVTEAVAVGRAETEATKTMLVELRALVRDWARHEDGDKDADAGIIDYVTNVMFPDAVAEADSERSGS